MAFPAGAYLTIIYSVLLHFTLVGTNSILFHALNTDSKVLVLSVQGLMFVSYPLIGLLADVKLTRYRMICLSCWVILISNIIGLIVSTIGVFGVIKRTQINSTILVVVVVTLVVLAIVGKGMFESTVIQFGTDQMIEASSAQLSTFIHLYYWSLYVGDFFVNIDFIVIYSYFSHCQMTSLSFNEGVNTVSWVFIPVCVIQSFLCCIVLLLLQWKIFKNYLNIEPVGVNPLKQVIDVLKYAYHHKYPVRRSALSYYRNTYPSRINFGKVQYGGPFTNEEVEDTKTVLRLLVLLLTLFGFHLSSDGFSTTSHILSKSCPSSLMLLAFIANPSFFSDVITLVGIPVFHLLMKTSLEKYFPNMLKRMWFGLLLLCLQELLTMVIHSQVNLSNCVLEDDKHLESSYMKCYISLIQLANETEWNTTDCVTLCPSSLYTMDSTLMWLLVPHILHGFGYMLVFVSVLEFICAQAPFRLKGFIVGIWYAMFFIKFIIINLIDGGTDYYHISDKAWIIYESIKIGIIGLSLIIFGISCRCYSYRERDEVVNVQGMIEDIFEKELIQQQNEEDSSESDENVSILISSQSNCTYSTFN